MKQPTVAVYVRKGATDEERLISFNPPPELSRAELVRMGYAMDRETAKRVVEANPKALHEAQKALQDWLEARGYMVDWR